MSQDFIWTYVDLVDPTMKDDARKKALLSYLKAMPMIEDEWTEFADNVGLEFDDNNGWHDEFRAEAESVITDFFNSKDSNDSSSFTVFDREIFITGGMSSGDDPTESYQSFNRINCMPMELLRKGKINIQSDPYKLFIAQYGERMPPKLKADLARWIKDDKILEKL